MFGIAVKCHEQGQNTTRDYHKLSTSEEIEGL
jgi:hypothetical protein